MRNNKLYCLRCPYTLEIRYIGITCKDIRGRLQRHINESRYRDNHKSNWIKKLTSEGKSPIIEIMVDNLTYEESLLLEVEYIKKYKEICNLVNISEGGDFNPSKLDSVRKKISEKLTGIKRSPESIEKMRISQLDKNKGSNNPFYNKKHTFESKAKMSESIKKSFSDEKMIEKLSSLKEKTKKPLLQLDMNGNLIKEWDSVSRIKRELNFDRKIIRQVCNGTYKQAYGFIWKYKK